MEIYKCLFLFNVRDVRENLQSLQCLTADKGWQAPVILWSTSSWKYEECLLWGCFLSLREMCFSLDLLQMNESCATCRYTLIGGESDKYLLCCQLARNYRWQSPKYCRRWSEFTWFFFTKKKIYWKNKIRMITFKKLQVKSFAFQTGWLIV